MRKTARRDPNEDRRVQSQGNTVFWFTLAAGLIIIVLAVVLAETL